MLFCVHITPPGVVASGLRTKRRRMSYRVPFRSNTQMLQHLVLPVVSPSGTCIELVSLGFKHPAPPGKDTSWLIDSVAGSELNGTHGRYASQSSRYCDQRAYGGYGPRCRFLANLESAELRDQRAQVSVAIDFRAKIHSESMNAAADAAEVRPAVLVRLLYHLGDEFHGLRGRFLPHRRQKIRSSIDLPSALIEQVLKVDKISRCAPKRLRGLAFSETIDHESLLSELLRCSNCRIVDNRISLSRLKQPFSRSGPKRRRLLRKTPRRSHSRRRPAQAPPPHVPHPRIGRKTPQ